MSKSTFRTIQVDGVTYDIEIVDRPFREGREARFEVNGESVAMSELGLGDKELELRITEEIRRRTSTR